MFKTFRLIAFCESWKYGKKIQPINFVEKRQIDQLELKT